MYWLRLLVSLFRGNSLSLYLYALESYLGLGLISVQKGRLDKPTV